MTTAHPTEKALLSAAVLGASATGPLFVLTRSWHVVEQEHGWAVVADAVDQPGPLPQSAFVEIGAAVQRMTVAGESQGHRMSVQLLPPGDARTVAVVRDDGRGPGQRASALLAAEQGPEQPPRALTPSDLRHLALTAETFGCELLWQSDAAPAAVVQHAQRLRARGTATSLSTLVTRGDDPADWFGAGRALAQCRLVAAALGLSVDQGPHALGHREVREEVRSTWRLPGWPQAQLSIVTSAVSS